MLELFRWALAAIAVGAMFPSATRAGPVADASPRSAHEILECGLRNRFDLDFKQVIEIRTKRAGIPDRRYRLQIAAKRFGDSTRLLAVFLAPADERGMKLLTIENNDRRDEYFLFAPFLGKVRRIYGGRQQEAFLGTDFAFEDMDRHRAEEFDTALERVEEVDDELVAVVSARPRYDSPYARSEYLIAQSDCQITEIRHFKRAASEPFKILILPHDELKSIGGVMMPTRVIARDLEFRRETEIRFSEIHVDPDLEAHYFEPSILERLDGIPGLSRGAGER